MTLHQLVIFTVVARHLNIRAAAQELRIAQPSVSKQLRGLENEFRTKFHLKVGRNIALTNEGRLFLKEAEALVFEAERLKKKFSGSPHSDRCGALTVGGSYNPSATFLPDVLALFKRTHPHVQLSLKTDTKRVIERMVSNGDVEIAAVSNPTRSADLVMELFRREKLLAFVLPSHPLAKKMSLTAAELARAPLVIRADTDSGMSATEEILRELENHGVALNIAVRCQSPEAVKASVRKHMGVGFLFEGLITADVERGDFKILKVRDLELVGQSFIVYHRERPLSQYAQEFLELLRRKRPSISPHRACNKP